MVSEKNFLQGGLIHPKQDSDNNLKNILKCNTQIYVGYDERCTERGGQGGIQEHETREKGKGSALANPLTLAMTAAFIHTSNLSHLTNENKRKQHKEPIILLDALQ